MKTAILVLAWAMTGTPLWGQLVSMCPDSCDNNPQQHNEDHLASAQAHINCAIARLDATNKWLDCQTKACRDKLWPNGNMPSPKECAESDALDKHGPGQGHVGIIPCSNCTIVPTSGQIAQAPFTGNGQTTTAPLKCDKYEHEVHLPQRCANTCDATALSCASVCYVKPAEDYCAPDIKVVTVKDWEELMARLNKLEHPPLCTDTAKCITVNTTVKP